MTKVAETSGLVLHSPVETVKQANSSARVCVCVPACLRVTGNGDSPTPAAQAPVAVGVVPSADVEVMRARAREVFKALDQNKDGLLDVDQIYDALCLMGAPGGGAGGDAGMHYRVVPLFARLGGDLDPATGW